MAIVIKNGLLVTMNAGRQVLNGDIKVEGSLITAVGTVETGEGDRVIDARGRIVAPGLVQIHTHLCQTLFRGLADDLELLDWLRTRIWPLEGAHDPESLYLSAMLGCAELLRGGTTAIVDMATIRHTDSVFNAVADSGIRYLGGKCLMDTCEQSNLREDDEDALQEAVDLMHRWHGQQEGRIQVAFCPRFAVSCSDRLLRQVAELARRYQMAVHTHASENYGEIQIIRREHGQENIAYLENTGLCGPRLILAHCIHINEEEMDILARHGVHVAHCPSSNLKLASGVAMIPEMLDKGINVGLGADGAPCNNRLCAFTEMRTAALIQKPRLGPRSMPAQQVLEMATLKGARALGMGDRLGSLEPGKIADIIMVDTGSWHNLPASRSPVYSQLVYQLGAGDVDMVMVDGRILVKEGRVLGMNLEQLAKQSGEALERVCKRAGLV